MGVVFALWDAVAVGLVLAWPQCRLRNLLHLRRHRRGEEQRLPCRRRRQRSQDLFNLLFEPHLEQLISFVQDEHGELTQARFKARRVVEVVLEPAWSCDQELAPCLQPLLLSRLLRACRHVESSNVRTSAEMRQLAANNRGDADGVSRPPSL